MSKLNMQIFSELFMSYEYIWPLNPNPRGILFDHIGTATRPEKAVLRGLSSLPPSPTHPPNSLLNIMILLG